MRIAHFANTFVGKPGNIGVRTAKVLLQLADLQYKTACICRGTVVNVPGTQFFSMGWFGHLPRALNAARIYLWPYFNHRPFDIAIFESFSLRQYDKLLQNDHYYKLAHVWDYCPRLIQRLKSDGVYVLLDVPIAPITYGRRMKASGRASFFIDDPKLMEIELTAFTEADQLIAPSKFVAEELVRAGISSQKIVVIEYGVDVSNSIPNARSMNNIREKRGIDFCFFGNINSRKGIPELLQAWSHHAFNHDRLHLCGRIYPEVKRNIYKAKGGQILLPGFCPTSYLSCCDVFVFLSWMEGSSKAVFEAMAAGLPSIVTTSSGSVVRDGIDGFVVEPGDTEALRELMLWFKDHPDQIIEMGLRAQERVREFSWSRYTARVTELYEEILL